VRPGGPDELSEKDRKGWIGSILSGTKATKKGRSKPASFETNGLERVRKQTSAEARVGIREPSRVTPAMPHPRGGKNYSSMREAHQVVVQLGTDEEIFTKERKRECLDGSRSSGGKCKVRCGEKTRG